MGLSDATVVKRALLYHSLRARAHELEDEAAGWRDQVIAELQARGTTRLVVAGVTVRVKASTTRTYDVPTLRGVLARAQFGRLTRLVADRVLIAAEIKAGRLTAELVAPALREKTGAPYLDVTPAGPP